MPRENWQLTRDEFRNAYLLASARAHVMFGKEPIDLERIYAFADALYKRHIQAAIAEGKLPKEKMKG